jgi:hypothetical protein
MRNIRFSKMVAKGENPAGMTSETVNGTVHWPVYGEFGASNTPERKMTRCELEKTRPSKVP